MKTVTLKSIEWQGDTSFFTPAETRSWYGVSRQVKVIVIHWWDTPADAGTLLQTVKYLKGAEESIHFVVSGDKVIQMVNMANTAFHAGSANPISVGIEVDPRTPGNTYETVGALVKFIRGYYGNVPLKKHSTYVSTQCPGTIDLKKIDNYAYGRVSSPASKPAPVAPTLLKKTTFSPAKHFKVTTATTLVNIPTNTTYVPSVYQAGAKVDNIVELLEYSDGKRFYRTSYARDTAKKMYGFGASKLTEVTTPTPDPKPEPPKPTAEEQKLEELEERLSALERVVDTVVKFLSDMFKGFTK